MEEDNGSGSSKHQNEVLEVSNTSNQDNSDLEVSNSSNQDNSDLEVSNSSNQDISDLEVSNSSNQDNSDLEVSNSSNQDNSDLEVSNSSNQDNSNLEVSNSSNQDNSNLEVSNSSNQDNSDLEDTTIDDENEQHLHAIITDEIPLNRAKIVAHDPLTSSSASSNLLDVDCDEKDVVDISSSSQDNGSDQVDAESESSAETSSPSPQWSMVSESPLYGPELNEQSTFSAEISKQNSGLNVENTSPMQSPVVQIMGRTASYDPDRIPWSTFTPRPENNADWTATSNDSLFSLYNGKSGELNKADFSAGLPTVMETASEIDRKSVSTIGEAGEKENLEIQNEAPIVSINEDGKGVDPASAVTEDASSMNSDSKKTPPPPTTPPAPDATIEATPKTGGGRKCFNCFSCCSSRG